MSIGSSTSQATALRVKGIMTAARPPKPDGTQPTDGKPSEKASAGPASTQEKGSAAAWPRKSTSTDGPRVEVDRRTEDSEAVRITVISYSDGSSESVTQMKADELVGRITDQIAKQVDEAARPSRSATSLNDKGLLVDKWA